jgi:hypothetical protein
MIERYLDFKSAFYNLQAVLKLSPPIIQLPPLSLTTLPQHERLRN